MLFGETTVCVDVVQRVPKGDSWLLRGMAQTKLLSFDRGEGRNVRPMTAYVQR